MSAIARYFASNGKLVAGYDKTPSKITSSLEELGVEIHFEDSLKNIPISFLDKDKTLVVYTPAIAENHTELNYFLNNNFKVLKRAEVLGKITESTFCLAVAGTHGNGIYTANIQFTVDTTDTIQGFAEDQSNGFEFELYPNPTNSGRVHVMSKGSKFESTTIALFDQYGRLLKSSEVASREFDLDVSGFSAGVYYVKVQSGADWSIKRFVKN